MSVKELNKLARRNAGLFDEAIQALFDDFWHEPSFQLQRNWRPTDVTETDDGIKLEIELPGFTKEQVHVEVTDRSLKVDAKSKRSSYSRAFADSRINWVDANVKLENGVLTVSAPRTEKAKSKVLKIQ
jgi:HSP20 family molecular chaperone IbpA